jgi:hypothetical protein
VLLPVNNKSQTSVSLVDNFMGSILIRISIL